MKGQHKLLLAAILAIVLAVLILAFLTTVDRMGSGVISGAALGTWGDSSFDKLPKVTPTPHFSKEIKPGLMETMKAMPTITPGPSETPNPNGYPWTGCTEWGGCPNHS